MGATEGLRLPLTAAQLGIWLGQQMDAASPAYWTAEAVELIGQLDVAAFEAAVLRAIAECEALHMRYGIEGDVVYQSPTPALPHLLQHDFSAQDEDSAWARAWQLIEDCLHKPADLAATALYATALLRVAPQRWLWVLRAHHVALDGYGYALLARRIAALYSGRDEGGARALLGAVVAEDLAYRESSNFNRDREFWVRELQTAPMPTGLAPLQTLAHSVLRLRGDIPVATLADWQAAASAAGVDWAAWSLAAIALWLCQQTGARDLTLGLPVMGRMGSAALTVPCMAMNIVPLRFRINPQESFAELARRVMARVRAMRPHQRYRYEDLRHDMGRRLFGPVVNLMPFDRPPACGDLQAISHPVSAGPVEDLVISIVPHAQGIRLDFEANPHAYDMSALLAHQQALHALLLRLQSASISAPLAELFDLPALAESSIDGGPLPQALPVLTLLQQAAERDAGKTAIVHGDTLLDYAGLLAQVRQLAGVLKAQGVQADVRVALLLPRTPQAVVAMLAVLWAGGGYIPLDVDSPDARIAAVLNDARPSLLLTDSRLSRSTPGGVPVLYMDQSWPAAAACHDPAAVATDALAYIIYTSGSTGRPNGVMIGRDALAHFVAGASARYAMRGVDRVLQFAPLHFDASVEEIYLSLCNGATLMLRDDTMLESLPRFAAACAAQRITVLDLPTAFWHELAFALGHGHITLPSSLRLVIIGGEAALPERVQRWRKDAPPSLTLLNSYGPTETTVICTTAVLAGPGAVMHGDMIPIGRPLPGLRAVIVDAGLRPVAVGEEGELCLMGGALARGYFEREDVSAARFVTLQAFDGARAYRTGDRARLGEDGQLYYLGRLDDELKISGHRIDPTEIETALLGCDGIREAAVIGQRLPEGGQRLVAFIVPDAQVPAARTLREQLAQVLPAAAIPAVFETLPRLPRNANNKIDRRALNARDLQLRAPASAASLLERCIIGVWQSVLGVPDIDAESDFFALGGKSLQAIQAASRIGMALQHDLPVSALFSAPTVAALAQMLANPDGHRAPAASDPYGPLLCLHPGRAGSPALFCIHPAEGLSWCYMGLARHLPHVPIYGLQSPAISGPGAPTMAALVEDYVQRILATQAEGPYRLLGWSSGGGIAHALAVALRARGKTVTLLAMMDSYPSDIWEGKPPPTERDALEALLDVIGESAYAADGRPLSEDEIRARLRGPASSLADADEGRREHLSQVALQSMHMYRDLRHGRFDGDLLFFRALRRPASAPDRSTWQPYIAGDIRCIDIDSSHNTMSRPAPLAVIGSELARYL
jgi:nonribosomal peptide synthetase MxcG